MKMNKWITPGLFVIVLAVAGAASAHDDNGCDKDGWSHGDGHSMSTLSDDQKKLLHETMKKVFEQDKNIIEQMHKLHKDMHEVLAADTFDARKFMALGAQIGKLRDKIHRDRMQAFASIAGQFTPEEREMIVKFYRHHHHHHDGEWRDHSMNDGSAAPQTGGNYPPYPSR
jgi:Spy/CpxP family protein refolding chaperone